MKKHNYSDLSWQATDWKAKIAINALMPVHCLLTSWDRAVLQGPVIVLL